MQENISNIDTADIWTTEETGIYYNRDGTPWGIKRKNVRMFNVSPAVKDSTDKAVRDADKHWEMQYKKEKK